MEDLENTQSFEQAVAQLQDGLESHDRLIAMLLGANKALRYALMLVIADHPNPAAFRQRWMQATLGLVDLHIEQPGHRPEDQQLGFQGVFAAVANVLDRGDSGQSPGG